MAGDPRLDIIKSYCRDRTREVFSNDWWLGLLGVLDAHALVVVASPLGVPVRVAVALNKNTVPVTCVVFPDTDLSVVWDDFERLGYARSCIATIHAPIHIPPTLPASVSPAGETP